MVKNEDEEAYQDVALHVVQGSCGLQGPSFFPSLSVHLREGLWELRK